MDTIWTSAEKRMELNDLTTRLDLSIFNGVKPQSCGKYISKCEYLELQKGNGNLTEDEMNNYQRSVCDKYPGVCILNIKRYQ